MVYDIGCNDGRVPVAAAAQCGARGVGVEVQAKGCRKARAAARAAGVEHLVTIVEGDAMRPDISYAPATVVYLYLLPRGLEPLGAKLRRELRPGTRVVSYLFRLPASWAGWTALEAAVAVASPRAGAVDAAFPTRLYLYRVLPPWRRRGALALAAQSTLALAAALLALGASRRWQSRSRSGLRGEGGG